MRISGVFRDSTVIQLAVDNCIYSKETIIALFVLHFG